MGSYAKAVARALRSLPLTPQQEKLVVAVTLDQINYPYERQKRRERRRKTKLARQSRRRNRS